MRRKQDSTNTSTPLDHAERAALDDFIVLVRDSLRLRESYLDPRRCLGGELLEDREVEQLRREAAPRLIELDRALLAVAKRAALLRALMRHDPDPKRPLQPGVYKKLASESFVRSEDELWQTAVAWIERKLADAHDQAQTGVETAVQALVERRLVTSDALTRAYDAGELGSYVRGEFQRATRTRARRGRKFAIGWLANLTKVSATTIRAAVKRAETPRENLPRGTTLELREETADLEDELRARVDKEIAAEVAAGTHRAPPLILHRG